MDNVLIFGFVGQFTSSPILDRAGDRGRWLAMEIIFAICSSVNFEGDHCDSRRSGYLVQLSPRWRRFVCLDSDQGFAGSVPALSPFANALAD